MVFATANPRNETTETAARRRVSVVSLPVILPLLLAFLLVACGSDGHHFRVKGKFRNLNQGEFYLYSLDGSLPRIDTIRVNRGQFSYEMPCRHEGVLVLVFPNFSELPIFSQPGKTVELKGDVSHLKELEVKGTKANEAMTAFRLQIASASPPEVKQLAARFVRSHSQSPASAYIVRRYLMQAQEPDMKLAAQLLDSLHQQQPDNREVARLLGKARSLQALNPGSRMPIVKATDIDGHSLNTAQLSKAEVAVVFAWATWSYDSTNLLRQLKQLQRSSKGRLQVVGICLDGSTAECRKALDRDSIQWPTVCEEEMADGKLLSAFGLSFMGDNVVYERGRVVKSGLALTDLKDDLSHRLGL